MVSLQLKQPVLFIYITERITKLKWGKISHPDKGDRMLEK